MGTTRQASPAPGGDPRGDGQGLSRREVAHRCSPLRSAAVALVVTITLGALTTPSSSSAMVRPPDPPARWSLLLTHVGEVITTLHVQSRDVPATQRRRLHEDLVLEVNAPWSTI